MHPLRFPDFAPTHALYRTTHPQAEAEELRAELERMRTSLDGLKAAQNEYVKSAKKVQRVERKLADRQAAGKVGGGSLRPADMMGEVGRQWAAAVKPLAYQHAQCSAATCMRAWHLQWPGFQCPARGVTTRALARPSLAGHDRQGGPRSAGGGARGAQPGCLPDERCLAARGAGGCRAGHCAWQAGEGMRGAPPPPDFADPASARWTISWP